MWPRVEKGLKKNFETAKTVLDYTMRFRILPVYKKENSRIDKIQVITFAC